MLNTFENAVPTETTGGSVAHPPLLVDFVATVPRVEHHGVASHVGRRPHDGHVVDLRPSWRSRHTHVSVNVKLNVHGNKPAVAPCVSPDSQIVIFSSPAPVIIRKSIHLEKLPRVHGRHSPEVTLVTQPVTQREIKIRFDLDLTRVTGDPQVSEINNGNKRCSQW